MIFVDSWAWIALAKADDQHHSAAYAQHAALSPSQRRYVTTNFVLGETISYLYAHQRPSEAQPFIETVLLGVESGAYQLIHVAPDQFRRAWAMRQKYHDKPDISFVDFTSMIVMQDMGIVQVFSGDAHFQHVGLGFHLVP